MKAPIFLIAILSIFVMSFAVPPKWERLGSRVVDFKLDKDIIAIGAHEGAYTKLKIQVSGGSVNMRKMVVHYGNGEDQNVELKYNFTKGSGSRVIDLPGNKRIIKSVTFFYDTKNVSKTKAKIHLFGKH